MFWMTTTSFLRSTLAILTVLIFHILTVIEEYSYKYVLTIGNWFRINRDFAQTVTRYVSQINDSTLALPQCLAKEKEKDYNKRAAQTVGNMLCLDRKTISIETHLNKIEVCDLLSDRGQLIHVKPWHSSSTLSHLFSQARVSGELLLLDQNFRRKVREKIMSENPRYVNLIPETNFDPRQIEIVLAVVDSDSRMLDARLPFFSKLNMMQATRFLNGLGYNVTKLKVVRTN